MKIAKPAPKMKETETLHKILEGNPSATLIALQYIEYNEISTNDYIDIFEKHKMNLYKN